jgi:metal-dependent amidase/aminoacylase/carboxypeptidase family protein
VPFASKAVGKQHACGHDGHMAIALAVARIVATPEWRSRMRGSVKFIFQVRERMPREK